MHVALRRLGVVFILALAGVYGYSYLRGPQGITALARKREEVKALQEQNANLRRVNTEMRNRIQKLRTSRPEQEIEIRKRLKLAQPDETQFILPGKPPNPAEQPAPTKK